MQPFNQQNPNFKSQQKENNNNNSMIQSNNYFLQSQNQSKTPTGSHRQVLQENTQNKLLHNNNSGLGRDPKIVTDFNQNSSSQFSRPPPYIKQSPTIRNISPDRLIKNLEQEVNNPNMNNLQIDEINRELDTNMNEIIILLNRRKALVNQKKRRLKQDFIERLNYIQHESQQNLMQQIQKFDIMENSSLHQLLKQANSSCQLPPSVLNDLFDENSSGQQQKMEMQASQEFWNNNKNIEGDVDVQLKKLKQFDIELENGNSEILNTCNQLDKVEENIKDLLIQKTEDHLQRAEPLFMQKQKLHDQLKLYTNKRNNIKDQKINLVCSIINALSELKNVREQRLSQLMNVFGFQENENSEDENSEDRIQQYINFVDQLEHLARVREELQNLDNDESPLLNEMDRIQQENDIIFTELVKKQSEEAKAYSEFSENLDKRFEILSVIQYFMVKSQLTGIQNMDIKDILKKFQNNIVFLKPLVEEDTAIKQGLQKTCETIHTFTNILKASQNEKERRQELISLLEECQRLKDLEENKYDEIRNQDLEITKKTKQKKNLEEDLESILTDADLEQYRKLDQQLKNHDYELQHMKKVNSQSQYEINQLQSEVVQKMNIIKNEYDDILKEFIPNNLMNTYDFQKANDIKNVKNQLKKAFKRLLGDQHHITTSQMDTNQNYAQSQNNYNYN